MKYDTKISLLCPVCNGSSFSQEGSNEVCANCKSTFTRAQLEKANECRINQQINKIYEKQILPDITKQMKTSLQKAFKGNPYIKIK
jgi:transposase-like protein